MAGIQIPIEVVDKFSKQLDSLNKGMDKLTEGAKKQNSTFNLLAADVVFRYGKQATDAIIKFGEDCLRSFADSEKAVSRLDQALKNQGFTSKQYSEALREQAAALQMVTIHSDEAIMETQTLLTTFGLAGKDLEKTTKAALDLASGLGIDLRSATMLMGKAWVGETGSLGRFGIKIDETLKGAEKFGAVLQQVQSRFGGAAQNEATTYAGRLEVLRNRFDELKEKIGKELLPVAESWTRWLTQGLTWVEKQVEGDGNLTKSKDKVLVSMRLHIEQLKDELDAQGRSTVRGALVEAQLNKEAKAYENLVRAMKSKGQIGTEVAEDSPKSKGAAKDMSAEVKLQEEHMALQRSAQQKLDIATMSSQELIELQDEQDAQMIEKALGVESAQDFIRARNVQKEKEANRQKAQDFASTMSFIATLSTAKNKELALIGKASAISLAYINTGVAITRALAAAPPPFNFALAAAVGAAGAAQIATIIGAPLREGGLVQGSPQGSIHPIGEDGRDEAVIPLEDGRAMRRIGQAIASAGGSKTSGVMVNVGGINITVHGGSESKGFAAQLAEEVRAETVDAITLALRMNNLATLNAGMAA